MGYFTYYIIDFPVKLRLFSDSNRNLQNIFFIIIIQHLEGAGGVGYQVMKIQQHCRVLV